MLSCVGNRFLFGNVLPVRLQLDTLPVEREVTGVPANCTLKALYDIALHNLGVDGCWIVKVKVDRDENILTYLFFDICPENEIIHSSYFSKGNHFIRNHRVYRSSPHLYKNWLTSLHMLFYSPLTIFVQEYLNKPPMHLGLRALVGMTVAPLVSLMGILTPRMSPYFNSMLGDLDFWINGLSNSMINSGVARNRVTDSCFAPDLHPCVYLENNGHLAFGILNITSICSKMPPLSWFDTSDERVSCPWSIYLRNRH